MSLGDMAGGRGEKEGWWWELEKWSTKATGKELEMKAPSNQNARLPSSGNLSKPLSSNGGR